MHEIGGTPRDVARHGCEPTDLYYPEGKLNAKRTIKPAYNLLRVTRLAALLQCYYSKLSRPIERHSKHVERTPSRNPA